MHTKSFLVIGGGIIGSTIAREILLRRLGDVTILDKEDHLGAHASGRNSGVVHSGINQKPDSLKARMCLRGSQDLRHYCKEMGVRVRECGTLVVAQNDAEVQVLTKLLEMGNAVGVAGLRIISTDELREREPNVVGYQALSSPTGAVVDSKGLLNAVGDEVEKLGGRFLLSNQVLKIEGGRVITKHAEFKPDHIINAAGLYSDEIAWMMGVGKTYRVIPFRGEYMEVENVALRSMVYQAPDLRYPFLSVHLTKGVDDRVLAGPTATLAWGREAYDKDFFWKEMGEMLLSRPFLRLITNGEFIKLAFQNARMSLSKSAFIKEIQKLIPSVQPKSVFPSPSGIRAQLVDEQGKMVNDIKVEFCDKSTHILNAVSPGMTASFAFARFVVDGIHERTQ